MGYRLSRITILNEEWDGRYLMKNIQVMVREYVFCPREDKNVKMEVCKMCIYHSTTTRIGFNSFVKCDYITDKEG